MKKLLVFILSVLPINYALSEEITLQDCQEFLPYHSYNIAVSGICGQLLPSDVVSQHNYFRGICTEKLGKQQSMQLMQQGMQKFNQALSMQSNKEVFCRAEANLVNSQ